MRFLRHFCWMILLSIPCLGIQAQPWKGGLKLHRGAAALNLRTAVTRLANQAIHQTPRPIYLRTLPAISAHLKKAPVFPLAAHPLEMYRGLALDARGKELQTILAKGMKVTQSHFTIWHGSYDKRAYRNDTKALFATTDPLLASTYAQMNRFRPLEEPFLPVVLHLKRMGEDTNSRQARTIEIPHDIPASWIYRVSVLLNIAGNPRWGELKFLGENGFLFTPYPEPNSPLKLQP